MNINRNLVVNLFVTNTFYNGVVRLAKFFEKTYAMSAETYVEKSVKESLR